MDTLTIRELRNHPGQAQAELARSGELLLTNNGKPVAVMLAVDGKTLDTTLEALRRVRGQLALSALRKQAASQNLSQLTAADIDAEIHLARKTRQA